VTIRMTPVEAADLGVAAGEDAVEVVSDSGCAEGCELVIVLGGDGTLLRGAELARPYEVPLVGVNLGHVGFLAEAERADLDDTVARIVAREYTVEERMTLAVTVRDGRGEVVAQNWAINEASIEKSAGRRMLELVVSIDGRPLSRWACDGVVAATPTGSTAYAFSAGGPIVWPEVQALLVVPIAAHALFARPLVVAPTSPIGIDLLPGGGEPIPGSAGGAAMWCDGRRAFDLPDGATVELRKGDRPVAFARLSAGSFTDRLVRKFDLPVAGWRGRADSSALVGPSDHGRPVGPFGP
jgi:NAD+ kinase